MRKVMLAVALFVAVPVFAQPVPASAGPHAVVVPESADQAAPAPAPKPPAKPQDVLVQLLAITANALQAAATLGTLAAVAVAALAVTYLLMFLVKAALKLTLSDEYKKLLRAALTVLTVVSGVLGYLVAGIPGAVAAGIGSAAASPTHDVLDGVRALKHLRPSSVAVKKAA